MKPKHQRLAFIVVSTVFFCISVLLVMRAFRDNLVFFYSPSDIESHAIEPGRVIRVGGLVQKGSIRKSGGDDITFDITDGNATLTVSYHGLLPNLFREGQGVVAEGPFIDKTHLQARTILAKHDETYMPREVVDALKRSGRWKGDAAAQAPAP